VSPQAHATAPPQLAAWAWLAKPKNKNPAQNNKNTTVFMNRGFKKQRSLLSLSRFGWFDVGVCVIHILYFYYSRRLLI